jgi:hypothetical protein
MRRDTSDRSTVFESRGGHRLMVNGATLAELAGDLDWV